MWSGRWECLRLVIVWLPTQEKECTHLPGLLMGTHTVHPMWNMHENNFIHGPHVPSSFLPLRHFSIVHTHTHTHRYTKHILTCLHKDMPDIWYSLALYIGGNDNIYEPDAFSQRSAVGYWWVSVCAITYEWRESQREDRAIEARWRYGCYSHISSSIFHQSPRLETWFSVFQCMGIFCSLLYWVYQWFWWLSREERKHWFKKEKRACDKLKHLFVYPFCHKRSQSKALVMSSRLCSQAK